MNVYETITIFDAGLNDENTEANIAKVAEIITGNGGEVVKTDVWGRRRMAYEINKHTRGNYVLYLHQSPPDTIKKLEDFFKVTDTVIKFMNVRLEKKQSAAALNAVKAAEAKAEEVKAAEAKAEEVKAAEAKAEEAPTTEAPAAEAGAEE